MAPKDQWIRLFQVSNPTKHKKGFTVYKVTSTVFPKHSPEAVTKVVVWKRYNDFKKLHKELQALHSKLHLNGKFPLFAKSKFFGRFEAEVIEERSSCALKLLEFTAEHPPLFTSQLFLKFFEVGYTIEEDVLSHTDELPSPIVPRIVPITLVAEEAQKFGAQQEGCPDADEGVVPMLGGTWQFLQQTETISLSSSSSDDQTTFTDTDDSVLSTPLADVLEPFFDRDPDWLSPESDDKAEGEENSDGLLDEFSRTWFEQQGEERPVTRNNANLLELEEELNWHVADYLFEAAQSISSAVEHECSANYSMALTFYKKGIGILMNGVQNDTDDKRKDLVKQKILKYISHAEEIYSKQFAGTCNYDRNWIPKSTTRKSSVEVSRGDLLELQNFRVLGIIGRLMLVMDARTAANNVYVMKVLYKSPRPSSKHSIVPQKLPYMIELHRYYETDYGILLLLQHARGGRLWDFVESYLHSTPPSPAKEGRVDFSTLGNVYSGKKFDTTVANIVEATGDSDLTAAPDCPASYVELFHEYASSAGQSVGLAKCHYVANPSKQASGNVSEAARSPPVAESSPPVAAREESRDVLVTCNKDVNGEEQNNAAEDLSWKDLQNIDTAELIRKAQLLLEEVDETLKCSDRATTAAVCPPKENVTKEEEIQKEEKKEDPQVIRQRRVSGRSMGSRKSSSNSLGRPCEQKEERLRSGSLSLPGRRCTVSALFDYLDGERYGSSRDGARLPESCVRVWAAELTLALEALHRCGLVCRDLKPSNLLLGEHGQLLLCYRAQWSSVEAPLDTQAQEQLYVAPELGPGYGGQTSHIPSSAACDWWSLGALLFELLIGNSLQACHPQGILPHTPLHIPRDLSQEATSLLRQLLCYEPTERLGFDGSHTVKSHPFFKGVNWSKIEAAS